MGDPDSLTYLCPRGGCHWTGFPGLTVSLVTVGCDWSCAPAHQLLSPSCCSQWEAQEHLILSAYFQFLSFLLFCFIQGRVSL